MKQVTLEIQLSGLKGIAESRPSLEQYSTPGDIAAGLLYRAMGEGNIKGRRVADFGTGNGIFAIGAYLLGASEVYAVERDKRSIEVARENAEGSGAKLYFYEGDVADFDEKVDTAIMNPPFGSQVRDADIPFIEKALDVSKNFYILLNFKSGDFLRKLIGVRGRIEWEEKMEFPLPHTYDFHRKEKKMVEVKVAKVIVCQKS